MHAHTLPRWHPLLLQTVQRSCPTYPNLQVTNSCSCSLFNWGHYTACTAWLGVFSSLTSWVLAGFESPILCCGGHVGLSSSHNRQYHHSGLTGVAQWVMRPVRMCWLNQRQWGQWLSRCCMPIEERARIKSVCALKKALSLNRACVFGAGRAESVA